MVALVTSNKLNFLYSNNILTHDLSIPDRRAQYFTDKTVERIGDAIEWKDDLEKLFELDCSVRARMWTLLRLRLKQAGKKLLHFAASVGNQFSDFIRQRLVAYSSDESQSRHVAVWRIAGQHFDDRTAEAPEKLFSTYTIFPFLSSPFSEFIFYWKDQLPNIWAATGALAVDQFRRHPMQRAKTTRWFAEERLIVRTQVLFYGDAEITQFDIALAIKQQVIA